MEINRNWEGTVVVANLMLNTWIVGGDSYPGYRGLGLWEGYLDCGRGLESTKKGTWIVGAIA